MKSIFSCTLIGHIKTRSDSKLKWWDEYVIGGELLYFLEVSWIKISTKIDFLFTNIEISFTWFNGSLRIVIFIHDW